MFSVEVFYTVILPYINLKHDEKRSDLWGIVAKNKGDQF